HHHVGLPSVHHQCHHPTNKAALTAHRHAPTSATPTAHRPPFSGLVGTGPARPSMVAALAPKTGTTPPRSRHRLAPHNATASRHKNPRHGTPTGHPCIPRPETPWPPLADRPATAPAPRRFPPYALLAIHRNPARPRQASAISSGYRRLQSSPKHRHARPTPAIATPAPAWRVRTTRFPP